MILSYPPFGIETRVSENTMLCLTLENPVLYSEFLVDLWNKSISKENSLFLLEGEKELAFDKQVDVVWNLVDLNCNESKILKKLYQEIGDYIVECYQEKLADLHGWTINFLEEIFEGMSYDLNSTLDINIPGLLKLYDVKIAFEEGSLEDRLVNYMKAVHRICRKEVFFVDGLKRYFNSEVLDKLNEFFSLEKLIVIDIEGYQLPSIRGEKTIIVDKDSCIIEL